MEKKMIARITSLLLAGLLLCVCMAGCAEKPLTLEEQLELGVRYLSELDYENAVIAFTAAIEIDPKNAQVYAGLYAAYVVLGNTEQADEVWAAMLEAGVPVAEMLSWVEKLADLITKGGGDGEAVKQAAQEKVREQEQGENGQPAAADGFSPAYVALQQKQIEVSVTPTDITADSVFNSDGYGVLRINEVIENDIGITPRMCALIDGAGRFVFPYEENWNDLSYSDGIITLYNSNSWYCGYFSPDGTQEIGCIIQGYYSIDEQPIVVFDEIERMQLRPFHDGIAFVRRGNYYAGAGMEKDESYLIDKNGEIILSLPESISKEVSMGSGPIYVGTEYSVYALDWDYCGNLGSASEGLIPFGCRVSLGDSIFNEVDISSVRWDTPMTCGYMDYSGNIAIPQQYFNNYPFSEGLAAVQNSDGLWGYINKSNNTVIPFKYNGASSFVDGLAAVSKEGKTGYINAQNEVVIPFEYEGGFTAGGGVCPVYQNGYYGLIDYNDNEVLPFEYDDISECINGVVYAVKDQQVYFITVK